MQKITPTLMFSGDAEGPLKFYTSVFKKAEIKTRVNWPDDGLLVARFTLNDLEFLVIGGGPECEFSMATSFMINCGSQEEVDYYWEKLGEGGEHQQCDWLRDKYGVSWQVVPTKFMELIEAGTKEQT